MRRGKATHHGRPLTQAEVDRLSEGTHIVITWTGGNGPHAYKVKRIERYPAIAFAALNIPGSVLDGANAGRIVDVGSDRILTQVTLEPDDDESNS